MKSSKQAKGSPSIYTFLVYAMVLFTLGMLFFLYAVVPHQDHPNHEHSKDIFLDKSKAKSNPLFKNVLLFKKSIFGSGLQPHKNKILVLLQPSPVNQKEQLVRLKAIDSSWANWANLPGLKDSMILIAAIPKTPEMNPNFQKPQYFSLCNSNTEFSVPNSHSYSLPFSLPSNCPSNPFENLVRSFTYSLVKHPDLTWFFFANDHTFLIPQNLHCFLTSHSSFDPSLPVYSGNPLSRGGLYDMDVLPLASGGAGVTLSHTSLKALCVLWAVDGFGVDLKEGRRGERRREMRRERRVFFEGEGEVEEIDIRGGEGMGREEGEERILGAFSRLYDWARENEDRQPLRVLLSSHCSLLLSPSSSSFTSSSSSSSGRIQWGTLSLSLELALPSSSSSSSSSVHWEVKGQEEGQGEGLGRSLQKKEREGEEYREDKGRGERQWRRFPLSSPSLPHCFPSSEWERINPGLMVAYCLQRILGTPFSPSSIPPSPPAPSSPPLERFNVFGTLRTLGGDVDEWYLEAKGIGIDKGSKGEHTSVHPALPPSSLPLARPLVSLHYVSQFESSLLYSLLNSRLSSSNHSSPSLSTLSPSQLLSLWPSGSKVGDYSRGMNRGGGGGGGEEEAGRVLEFLRANY